MPTTAKRHNGRNSSFLRTTDSTTAPQRQMHTQNFSCGTTTASKFLMAETSKYRIQALQNVMSERNLNANEAVI